MAQSDNGSLHDDSYLSEDSESNQSTYSDLDYNINVDVLLPNGAKQKTTIPAHTPWGDVRTHLCSQFKLSPSSHVVDFISDSTKDKKRRASLPVGRLNITMITIKVKGHQTKHAAPPPPIISADQGSVRLIVRLPRQRQSILRVNPDVPLSSIFTNISNKLKMDEETKGHAEFRHPEQHDVKLNSKFSLNHYNLREVYLTRKSEIAASSPASNHNTPPVKAKRKAPPPPRPPPPNLSTRSQSTSAATEDKVAAEPVYAQVQKKPKPKKRRSAPSVPQTIEAKSLNGELAKLKEVKAKVEEVASQPRHDVFAETNNISHDSVAAFNDDPCVYATIDDLEKTEDKHDLVVDGAMDDVMEKSNENVISDDEILQSIDEVLESDAEKDIIDGEEENVGAINSIDDVLEKFDDVAILSESEDEESHVKEEEPMEEGVGKKSEEEEENQLEKNVHPLQDSDKVADSSPVDDVISQTHLGDELVPADHSESNAPAALTLDENEPEIAIPEQMSLHPVTSLPRDGDRYSPTESAPKPDDISKEVAEADPPNVDFDLHIAESFNIPLLSIDEQRTALNKDKVEIKNKEVPKPEQPKLKAKENLPVKQEIKSAIEIENEKTAKEIEKLHRQIKMMRSRNSQKQIDAEAARNNWQSGSFVFVPNKKPEASHDDYDVAPVNAIQLSNSGEMKALSKDEKKETDPSSVVRAEALTRKNKLPSYYKKFLGAQAFAAQESK